MEAVQTSERLQRWVAFVRAHGQPCFAGWPAEGVAQWLKWHAQNGSLVVIEENGETLGLATGWQCFESELETMWYADNPAGDCYYFSHCVAKTPAAMAALLWRWNLRWPHWRQLKLFWRRSKRGLVPVPRTAITKLYSLVQRRANREMVPSEYSERTILT